MKKKIMIIVLSVSLFQSLRAESFDEPLLFEENHQVLTDIQVVAQPKKQAISVWTALRLAPRYIYETHVKTFRPRFYAFVASLFKIKNRDRW